MSVSSDRTLAILHQEAAAGKIDRYLLELFEHHQIYDAVGDLSSSWEHVLINRNCLLHRSTGDKPLEPLS